MNKYEVLRNGEVVGRFELDKKEKAIEIRHRLYDIAISINAQSWESLTVFMNGKSLRAYRVDTLY